MTKAISLDFWGTIADFNPEYRHAVIAYFSQVLNVPHSEAEVRYKTTKDACDHEAANSGIATTPHIAVGRLAQDEQICIPSAVMEINRLVAKHPPRLHPSFRQVIDHLHTRGHIVGVASNTNFIAGSAIQSVFNLPWDFEVYSDEIQASKPSEVFFHEVLARMGRGTSIPIARYDDADSTIHIGDNLICDGAAIRLGMGYRFTKSPDDTIEFLQTL